MKRLIIFVTIFQIFSVIAQSEDWHLINNTFELNVTCFAKDSLNNYYAGTLNGIYISKDKGKNWEKLNPDIPCNFRINNIVIDSKNELYFSTHFNGLFSYNLSTNSLKTENHNIEYCRYSKIFKNSKDELFAIYFYDKASPDSLMYFFYKFENNKWNVINTFYFYNQFCFDGKYFYLTDNYNTKLFNSENSIFESYKNPSTIYKSSVRLGSTVFAIEGYFKIDNNNQNNFSATINTYSILKSIDSGKSWRKLLNGIDGLSYNDILTLDSNNLYVATSNGIYYSNNSGEKFINTTDSLFQLENFYYAAAFQVLFFDNEVLYCGTNKGIYCTKITKHSELIPYEWQNKGKYKECKISGRKISNIAFNNNRNEMIINSDESLKYFDLNTLKINSILTKIKKNETYYFNQIYGFSQDFRKFVVFDGIRIISYDVENDSIKRVTKPFINNYCNSLTYGDYNIQVNNKDQIFFLQYGQCNWKFSTTNGFIGLYNLLNDSIKSEVTSDYFEKPIISPNAEYAIINNNYVFNIVNALSKTISSKFLSGAKCYTISENNEFTAFCKIDSKIEIYKLNDFSFTTELYYSKSGIVYSMIFKDNLLITATKDGEIAFWNLLNKKPFYIFQIDSAVPQLNLKFLNEQYFIIYSDDGYIRLVDYSIINSVESESSKYTFSISPNPASDYIEINLGAGSKPALMIEFEIFNIFGEKITTPSNLSGSTPLLAKEGIIKLDISNLIPGVYFVRVGGKFEKFVKI
jgi:hypothetical protein